MHDIGRKTLLVAGLLVFVTIPAAPAETETAAEDPWNGKPRAAIVELLGEPQKVKKAGRDGETLTYKVYRGEATALIQSGMRVIPVPGVGVVGIKPMAPDSGETITIGPTEVDEQGRGTGGGITQTTSRSYDLEGGKIELTDSPAGGVPGIRKVKLRFVLDGDGRVREWSAGSK